MMHGNKDSDLIDAHPDRRRPHGRCGAEALPIARLKNIIGSISSRLTVLHSLPSAITLVFVPAMVGKCSAGKASPAVVARASRVRVEKRATRASAVSLAQRLFRGR
jgi:hypothetical protein